LFVKLYLGIDEHMANRPKIQRATGWIAFRISSFSKCRVQIRINLPEPGSAFPAIPENGGGEGVIRRRLSKTSLQFLKCGHRLVIQQYSHVPRIMQLPEILVTICNEPPADLSGQAGKGIQNLLLASAY
jgi:hypothetical protein